MTDEELRSAAAATHSHAERVGREGARFPEVTTFAVDVGGSGVKAELLRADGTTIGRRERIEVHYPCPPDQMIGYVCELAGRFERGDRAAIGFPGMVRGGRVLSAPHFVTAAGPGSALRDDLVAAWTGLDLARAVEQATGLPTRVGNDADVAGLSVIRGMGVELVITLGTGLGTALFRDGQLAPHLELAHHPFRGDRSYNENVGDAARRALGEEKWTERVTDAVRTLRALTFYDTLYIGGGNSGKLVDFTEPAVIVDNVNGILGGLKLWTQHQV